MGCCKCCCILLLVSILVIGASLGLFSAFFPYPSHASCRVNWTFGKSCSTVKRTLKNQMREWSTGDCNLKQQCNYQYLGEDGNTIRGTHKTALIGFVDNLNFTFARTSEGCSAEGASESSASYAVIDFGTNYCNLRNLVIGSNLDKNDPYYKESSTNALCTMYSIAHCNLYT